MPIYDYRCDHCGHAFSAVQSFNDAPIEVCPSCGKKPRRLIVPPAIVFKGSGWYKTDSRAAPKGESNAAKAEAKPDAKPTATSESKSEPKAAPAKSEGAS